MFKRWMKKWTEVLWDVNSVILLHTLRYPSAFCLFAWIITTVIITVKYQIFSDNGGIFIGVCSLIIITFVYGIICIWIIVARHNWMTFISEDTTFSVEKAERELVLLKVDAKGKVIEHGQMMWKSENTIIHKITATTFDFGGFKYLHSVFLALVEYNNIKMTLPIEITSKIDWDFDWQEVYDVVVSEAEEIDISTFVRLMFEEYITNDQWNNVLVGYLGKMGGNKIELLSSLRRLALEFPRDPLLFNLGEITIRIEEPKLWIATSRPIRKMVCEEAS